MDSIPTDIWSIVAKYTDQMTVIAELHNEIDHITTNFEFIVDDNLRMESVVTQLNERILVLERTQLMFERQAARLRRKNEILRNRNDVLERENKRRRLGPLLERTLEYDSTADVSSDSDVTVIVISDTE